MSPPQVVEREDGYRGDQWMYGYGCFILLDGAAKMVRWGLPGEEEGISCR
jgi:hypothetical protein